MNNIRIALISDHVEMCAYFIDCVNRLGSVIQNDCYCSAQNYPEELALMGAKPINLKDEVKFFISTYDIVFSIHSKQIFPRELVEKVRCYNLHPGYNPYNRGWYPHVFSILNKLPAGATIHRMDEKIDHGYIVDQEKVEVTSWDTSLTLYRKVIEKEKEILSRSLKSIIEENYIPKFPDEGNYNSKKQYELLKELPLEETMKLKDAIDLLRALTHPPFQNAYFIDFEKQQKVFVEIILTPENEKPT